MLTSPAHTTRFDPESGTLSVQGQEIHTSQDSFEVGLRFSWEPTKGKTHVFLCTELAMYEFSDSGVVTCVGIEDDDWWFLFEIPPFGQLLDFVLPAHSRLVSEHLHFHDLRVLEHMHPAVADGRAWEQNKAVSVDGQSLYRWNSVRHLSDPLNCSKVMLTPSVAQRGTKVLGLTMYDEQGALVDHKNIMLDKEHWVKLGPGFRVAWGTNQFHFSEWHCLKPSHAEAWGFLSLFLGQPYIDACSAVPQSNFTPQRLMPSTAREPSLFALRKLPKWSTVAGFSTVPLGRDSGLKQRREDFYGRVRVQIFTEKGLPGRVTVGPRTVTTADIGEGNIHMYPGDKLWKGVMVGYGDVHVWGFKFRMDAFKFAETLKRIAREGTEYEWKDGKRDTLAAEVSKSLSSEGESKDDHENPVQKAMRVVGIEASDVSLGKVKYPRFILLCRVHHSEATEHRTKGSEWSPVFFKFTFDSVHCHAQIDAQAPAVVIPLDTNQPELLYDDDCGRPLARYKTSDKCVELVFINNASRELFLSLCDGFSSDVAHVRGVQHYTTDTAANVWYQLRVDGCIYPSAHRPQHRQARWGFIFSKKAHFALVYDDSTATFVLSTQHRWKYFQNRRGDEFRATNARDGKEFKFRFDNGWKSDVGQELWRLLVAVLGPPANLRQVPRFNIYYKCNRGRVQLRDNPGTKDGKLFTSRMTLPQHALPQHKGWPSEWGDSGDVFPTSPATIPPLPCLTLKLPSPEPCAEKSRSLLSRFEAKLHHLISMDSCLEGAVRLTVRWDLQPSAARFIGLAKKLKRCVLYSNGWASPDTVSRVFQWYRTITGMFPRRYMDSPIKEIFKGAELYLAAVRDRRHAMQRLTVDISTLCLELFGMCRFLSCTDLCPEVILWERKWDDVVFWDFDKVHRVSDAIFTHLKDVRANIGTLSRLKEFRDESHFSRHIHGSSDVREHFIDMATFDKPNPGKQAKPAIFSAELRRELDNARRLLKKVQKMKDFKDVWLEDELRNIVDTADWDALDELKNDFFDLSPLVVAYDLAWLWLLYANHSDLKLWQNPLIFKARHCPKGLPLPCPSAEPSHPLLNVFCHLLTPAIRHGLHTHHALSPRDPVEIKVPSPELFCEVSARTLLRLPHFPDDYGCPEVTSEDDFKKTWQWLIFNAEVPRTVSSTDTDMHLWYRLPILLQRSDRPINRNDFASWRECDLDGGDTWVLTCINSVFPDASVDSLCVFRHPETGEKVQCKWVFSTIDFGSWKWGLFPQMIEASPEFTLSVLPPAPMPLEAADGSAFGEVLSPCPPPPNSLEQADASDLSKVTESRLHEIFPEAFSPGKFLKHKRGLVTRMIRQSLLSPFCATDGLKRDEEMRVLCNECAADYHFSDFVRLFRERSDDVCYSVDAQSSTFTRIDASTFFVRPFLKELGAHLSRDPACIVAFLEHLSSQRTFWVVSVLASVTCALADRLDSDIPTYVSGAFIEILSSHMRAQASHVPWLSKWLEYAKVLREEMLRLERATLSKRDKNELSNRCEDYAMPHGTLRCGESHARLDSFVGALCVLTLRLAQALLADNTSQTPVASFSLAQFPDHCMRRLRRTGEGFTGKWLAKTAVSRPEEERMHVAIPSIANTTVVYSESDKRHSSADDPYERRTLVALLTDDKRRGDWKSITSHSSVSNGNNYFSDVDLRNMFPEIGRTKGPCYDFDCCANREVILGGIDELRKDWTDFCHTVGKPAGWGPQDIGSQFPFKAFMKTVEEFVRQLPTHTLQLPVNSRDMVFTFLLLTELVPPWMRVIVKDLMFSSRKHTCFTNSAVACVKGLCLVFQNLESPGHLWRQVFCFQVAPFWWPERLYRHLIQHGLRLTSILRTLISEDLVSQESVEKLWPMGNVDLLKDALERSWFARHKRWEQWKARNLASAAHPSDFLAAVKALIPFIQQWHDTRVRECVWDWQEELVLEKGSLKDVLLKEHPWINPANGEEPAPFLKRRDVLWKDGIPALESSTDGSCPSSMRIFRTVRSMVGMTIAGLCQRCFEFHPDVTWLQCKNPVAEITTAQTTALESHIHKYIMRPTETRDGTEPPSEELKRDRYGTLRHLAKIMHGQCNQWKQPWNRVWWSFDVTLRAERRLPKDDRKSGNSLQTAQEEFKRAVAKHRLTKDRRTKGPKPEKCEVDSDEDEDIQMTDV